MKYKDLKKYFNENRDKLPESVGNSFKVIPDLRKTIDSLTNIIEVKLKNNPEGMNKDRVALTTLNQLIKIYEMIQNPATHGVNKFNTNNFSNYNRQN